MTCTLHRRTLRGRPGRLALAVVLAVCWFGAQAVAAQQSVLGPDGQVFRARTGTYGELFPNGHETNASDPVVALEIVDDNAIERIAVPASLDDAIEGNPSILLDTAGDRDTLYLVWTSTLRSYYSRVVIVARENGTWGEPIEISGDPFTSKGPARVAVTRDQLERDGETVTRTVLHTVWWENGGEHGSQVAYAPIVLVDGAMSGINDLYRLNPFGPEEPVDAALPSDALVQAPAIIAGNGHSTIAAFADARTRRLVTLELSPIPAALEVVGDGLHEFLRTQAARTCQNGGTEALIAAGRNYITEAATALHPSLSLFLAASLADHLADAGCPEANASNDELEAIAEEGRSHIILIGARTSSEVRLDRGRSHIILIGVRERARYQGAVRRLETRRAPGTGNAPTEMLLSRDGSRVLVAWQPTADRIHYRESEGSGWSQVNRLQLDDELTLEQARRVLVERIQ